VVQERDHWFDLVNATKNLQAGSLLGKLSHLLLPRMGSASFGYVILYPSVQLQTREMRMMMMMMMMIIIIIIIIQFVFIYVQT
jgi:hypothetical protein